MTVLVVAEKPSAARRLAEILGQGGRKRGEIAGVPVHEVTRDGEAWRIVGLRGHVVEVDYPDEYNASWSKIPPRELIDVEPEHQPKGGGFEAALDAASVRVDRVIVATDHDREGELIGLEAVEHLMDLDGIPVQRARFSSLTEGAVEDAFEDPETIDEDLARSAEARQLVDLAWGATLTRFVSLAAERYGDAFLSVGRVQSPTLGLVVEREQAIEAFEPEPYWRLHARLARPGEDGPLFAAVEDVADRDEIFDATHERDRFEDADAAAAALDAARSAEVAEVVEADREVSKDHGPPPFDTTAFIGAATSRGLSAKQAMDAAESLYNKGLVSYPRTDNRVYPDDLDLHEVVRTLTGSEHGGWARDVLDQDRLYPTRGKTESTDHPPIHPTGAASEADLSKRQWKVYDLVVRRFLATVAAPSVEETAEVAVDVGGERFEAEGYRVLDPGWRRYYPYFNDKTVVVPEVETGDELAVVDVADEEETTEPPDRYRQGGLVKAMADKGLGTKSTRHHHVQKLYDRGYIEGESIRPTASGRAVVEALQDHAADVASPGMTADLEESMDRVAEGERSLEEVVDASRRMLDDVFEDLEAHEEAIADQLRSALRSQREARKEELTWLGPCPDCDEQLVVRTSDNGRFAGCLGYDDEPRCTTTYNLPNRGGLEPLDEVCEACGTPRVKVLMRNRKPWVICLDMDCDGPGGAS